MLPVITSVLSSHRLRELSFHSSISRSGGSSGGGGSSSSANNNTHLMMMHRNIDYNDDIYCTVGCGGGGVSVDM